jgi:hypothetical protein
MAPLLSRVTSNTTVPEEMLFKGYAASAALITEGASNLIEYGPKNGGTASKLTKSPNKQTDANIGRISRPHFHVDPPHGRELNHPNFRSVESVLLWDESPSLQRRLIVVSIFVLTLRQTQSLLRNLTIGNPAQ